MCRYPAIFTDPELAALACHDLDLSIFKSVTVAVYCTLLIYSRYCITGVSAGRNAGVISAIVSAGNSPVLYVCGNGTFEASGYSCDSAGRRSDCGSG